MSTEMKTVTRGDTARPLDFGLEPARRRAHQEREERRRRDLAGFEARGATLAWIVGIAIYLVIAVWIAEELAK